LRGEEDSIVGGTVHASIHTRLALLLLPPPAVQPLPSNSMQYAGGKDMTSGAFTSTADIDFYIDVDAAGTELVIVSDNITTRHQVRVWFCGQVTGFGGLRGEGAGLMLLALSWSSCRTTSPHTPPGGFAIG
jgi:hypothetical protein